MLVPEKVAHTQTRYKDIQPNNFPETFVKIWVIPFELYNLYDIKWKYLARAIELFGLELRQTISFALLIVITIVNTSSKRYRLCIVNASIPVLVFFDKLNDEF